LTFYDIKNKDIVRGNAMAQINYIARNQTIADIDNALEFKKKLESPRHYLGMSEIGDECYRKLFYSYRNAKTRVWGAKGVRAVEDGFMQEAVMAERLRMLPYITLHTVDPDDPKNQIGFEALLGHLRGHCDGIIKGIIEAPKTWHIWEHKSVNDKKFDELEKLIDEKGEKDALIEWDVIYYAQAQLYMHFAKLTRHFLTVTSPGGRRNTSCRTEYSQSYAEMLIAKGQSIIFDNWVLPPRMSDKREFYKCKWCHFLEICHDGDIPAVHCKTCRYRKSVNEGLNLCELKECNIEESLLHVGCPEHIFNPAMIQGAKLIEHKPDYASYIIPGSDLKFANTSLTGFPDVEDGISAFYTSTELATRIKNVKNIATETASVLKSFKGEVVDDDSEKVWKKTYHPKTIDL
jgi:hypothetical protein